MEHIKIEYSRGRGKYGKQYVYVRPSKKCFNRSRRWTPDKLQQGIEKHFPVVHYYLIDGFVIGAKNPEFALMEYYRVCDPSKIGQPFDVTEINPPAPGETPKPTDPGKSSHNSKRFFQPDALKCP